MLEKLSTMWNNCVNKGRNFMDSYRSGDPLIVKKDVNIGLSFFKKSNPDKKLLNLSVSGEPETTVLDLTICIVLVTMLIASLGLLSDIFDK